MALLLPANFGATVGFPLPREAGVILAVGAGVEEADGVGVAAGVSEAPATVDCSMLAAGDPSPPLEGLLAGGGGRRGGIFKKGVNVLFLSRTALNSFDSSQNL